MKAHGDVRMRDSDQIIHSNLFIFSISAEIQHKFDENRS